MNSRSPLDKLSPKEEVRERRCFGLDLHCCDKHHDKKRLGKKSFFFPSESIPQSITEGHKDRNLGAGMIQKSSRSTAYWLSLWLSQPAFLYIPGPLTCPGGGTTHIGLVLPHQSSVKKMSYRLASRPMWWGIFLSRGPLFPNASGMCQINKILASTTDPLTTFTKHVVLQLPPFLPHLSSRKYVNINTAI